MKIDPRSRVFLGLAWLLTCILAYWLGRGLDPQAAGRAASSMGSRGDRSTDASAGESKARGSLTALHRGGTVGRFLTFTKTLRDDELARLLPEMTEKMGTAEVQQALGRLLDDVRPGPARRLARFELIDRWAQLDAAAAFAHIDRMDASTLKDDLKKRAIKGWASVDPAATRAWIDAAENLPDHALRSVWEGIKNSKDLRATLDFIPSLGPGSNQYSQPNEIWDIYMTLHSLYQKDDKTVIAWVEKLPPGETRNRALHSMIDQWARHDPPAAREWIEQHADASNKTIAYVELAESWGRHDPQAAVAWAATLPSNTDGLRQIYERMFTRFIQYDYENAANYLVGQEPSPTLDTAFEVYIEKVKSIDPGASMEWAAEITDADRRLAAMSSVASIWRGRDRAALERYVEQSGLDDTQKNLLLGKE